MQTTVTMQHGLIREIGDVVTELLKGRPLTMPVFQEICTNQLIQEMLKHGPAWMHLSDCLLLDPLGRFHEAMIILAQNQPHPVAEFLSANQATTSAVCTLVLFLLAGKQLTRKMLRALHDIPAIEQLLRNAPVRMKLNDCLIEGGFRDDMIRLAYETEAARAKAATKTATNEAMKMYRFELKDALDVIISQAGKAVLLKKLGNMVEIKEIRAKAPEPINLKSLIEGDGNYVLLGEGSNIAVVHERMMRACSWPNPTHPICVDTVNFCP